MLKVHAVRRRVFLHLFRHQFRFHLQRFRVRLHLGLHFSTARDDIADAGFKFSSGGISFRLRVREGRFQLLSGVCGT